MILEMSKYLLQRTRLLGSFTVFLACALSCSNDRVEISKEEFLGHIETVQRYHCSVLKETDEAMYFVGSIMFLEELTGQASHASTDWFIGYPIGGGYHEDMEYWYSWCERHCK